MISLFCVLRLYFETYLGALTYIHRIGRLYRVGHCQSDVVEGEADQEEEAVVEEVCEGRSTEFFVFDGLNRTFFIFFFSLHVL